jgi:RecA-family ATPase
VSTAATIDQQSTLDLPENFLLSDRLSAKPKEPEWIFDGLWQARTFALFTGDGGLGKSHFTLQLAVAVASGEEILGTPIRCTQPREFIYISQEDEGDYITGELLNQYPELKRKPEISQRVRIISTAIEGKTMLVRDPATQKYLSDSIPENSVFALDAFSTFIRGNEIDNTEMQKEMAAIRALAKKRKASPLLIHHRPKANQIGQKSTFRGAVSIQQPIRFHIMFERKTSGTILSFEKVSRGIAPDAVTLCFDEERRLFTPVAADRYVRLFQPGETLTTTEVIKRIGLDPTNDHDCKTVLNALGYRSKNFGSIQKVNAGKNREEATWTLRIAPDG